MLIETASFPHHYGLVLGLRSGRVRSAILRATKIDHTEAMPEACWVWGLQRKTQLWRVCHRKKAPARPGRFDYRSNNMGKQVHSDVLIFIYVMPAQATDP